MTDRGPKGGSPPAHSPFCRPGFGPMGWVHCSVGTVKLSQDLRLGRKDGCAFITEPSVFTASLCAPRAALPTQNTRAPSETSAAAGSAARREGSGSEGFVSR